MLSSEEVRFFRDNGYLIVRGAIPAAELKALQEASQVLIERGPTEDMPPGERMDYQYGSVRGRDRVLRRIEYLIGKGEPFVHLLGNPTLLDAVQKVVGEQFVPTYDSMVVKMPGGGVEVPWHRDGGGPVLFFDEPATGRRFPAVNFDIYLDKADEESGALWVVPGSNRDGTNRTPELVKQGGYSTVPGAILVPMQPGDMLLHDVMLYHGSPETENAPLRRVIYYEFRDMRFINHAHRPVDGEEAPHKWPEEWTRKRLALLKKALDARQAAGLDVLFNEHPEPALRVPSHEAAQAAARVAHPGWDEAAIRTAA